MAIQPKFRILGAFSMEKETAAIGEIGKLLSQFDETTQERILRYVAEASGKRLIKPSTRKSETVVDQDDHAN